MDLNNKFFVFISMLLSLSILSCSGSKESSITDKKENEKYSLNEFEKSFDPTKYDLSYETTPKKDISVKKSNVSKKATNGFRIQIVITDNLNECQKKRNEMQKLFPEYNFYLIHEFPFYKLRMGDFATRKEAEIHLKYLNEKNIKSIMIVPDKINSE
ncbi:MAG TPA: SPOR domain-containing protein [Ignavibacteria bacterium]|jgi:hypothetical protein